MTWPAEWEPHAACWLAWPSHPEEWKEDLQAAQGDVVALCAAIADVDSASNAARGEPIEMLVLDTAGEASARAALGQVPGQVPVRYHRIPFGDIWLRDTGPIFVRSAAGLSAACFAFNGWGHKYLFAHDPEVGARIGAFVNAEVTRYNWVLEGGAIDGDGQGTVLTTRQCLLNRNRNPDLDRAAVEDQLARALGSTTVIWLDNGLENDHTDGHVDTLARFVALGRVVCMRAHDRGDPNRVALDRIAQTLAGARDARGCPLEVIEIPSPGPVMGADGMLLPASYVNFYIGNRTVVVPVYGTPYDDRAVRDIAALFPERRTVGVEARGLLSGGGAFHCVTREQPQVPPMSAAETP